MSGSIPDIHGSVEIAAGPQLQLRLVMTSQSRDMSDDTDACAPFSSPIIDQDPVTLHENRRIPSISENDEGRVATEDEVRDLLHVVDRIPPRLWIACVAGILERFVWYGATAPLRT